MSVFSSQQCSPIPENTAPLTQEESRKNLKHIDDGWSLSDDNLSISRTFKFKNYYETIAFVNAVAMVAHQQDHHPEMSIRYNTCHIEYSTHSIGGLSFSDFICASKIDHLLNL